mmetsp:Transcript_3009/g.10021  ORF Transcript_3009/g.10021 Transcript_3009/m.10021 type:complete len:216 (+) Transcript_3009:185-832(+)
MVVGVEVGSVGVVVPRGSPEHHGFEFFCAVGQGGVLDGGLEAALSLPLPLVVVGRRRRGRLRGTEEGGPRRARRRIVVVGRRRPRRRRGGVVVVGRGGGGVRLLPRGDSWKNLLFGPERRRRRRPRRLDVLLLFFFGDGEGQGHVGVDLHLHDVLLVGGHRRGLDRGGVLRVVVVRAPKAVVSEGRRRVGVSDAHFDDVGNYLLRGRGRRELLGD